MCGCFYCRKEEEGLKYGHETLCVKVRGSDIAT